MLRAPVAAPFVLCLSVARTLACALACALVTMPAAAQNGFLQSLDFDGDGIVTIDEAMASRNLQFPIGDLNGDEHLNAAEFDALLRATRARFSDLGQKYQPQTASAGRIDAFTFSDSDADGVISRQEYFRSSDRFARSLDRDGDGTISPDDISR
ncbi:calcium sensor EFh [Phaeobacter sp. B1627]|nr:calcium sensor EFh [Phaeobacter sp. B1627]